MNSILYWIKKIIPTPVLNILRPTYHYLLAFISVTLYKNPSKKIIVIAITGTKGKSTVTELITSIFEAHGKKVASLSTIQFKIDNIVKRNLYKMTMPGRFFLQKFLRNAVNAGCEYAIIEMTSEGAKQFRHKFVQLDALVFTNLTPEHIESHGSFQKYKEAKLKIAKQLEISIKQPRYIVSNTDDEHGEDFLNIEVEEKLPYNLDSLKLYTLHKDGIGLIFQDGEEEITIRASLVGLFNVYNTLAAITLTRAFGVPMQTIETILRSLPPIKGRVEHFFTPKESKKQITAIVDYAHTPDSLEKLYQAFKDVPKICVLGNCGGGRDTWKRSEMAHIAEEYCDHIILTNEDPYDENPRKIVEDMAKGIENKDKLSIIMDRRMAIAEALKKSESSGYIIISGKGTDPYIMGAHNSRQEWSDTKVVQEEIKKLFG